MIDARVLAIRVVRAGQVRRAAEQLGQCGPERIQRLLRASGASRAPSPAPPARDSLRAALSPLLRQLAAHATLELGREFRELRLVSCERWPATGFELAPRSRASQPLRISSGITKRLVRPLELLARRGDFLCAERGAVRRFGALLVRRAVPDDRLAADQRRAVVLRLGRDDRGFDRLGIVAVDVRQRRASRTPRSALACRP